MIEVLYRYRVHPAQVRAFEHAYGQQGPWVGLFSKHRWLPADPPVSAQK